MKALWFAMLLVGCSNNPDIDKYHDPVRMMSACREMCKDQVVSFSPEQSGLLGLGSAPFQCKCVVKEAK